MYHIILNPVAGKKRARKNLAVIERILNERKIPYEAHITGAANDAKETVRRLTADGVEDILVLGGDGTLHEVLNGLVDPTKCRLGLIPSGTGNDFATKIGLPTDPEKAILKVIDGEAKPTDYLEVSGIRCMNVCGMGMDVDVLERCNRGKKKGKLKYFWSLLHSLFTFKGIPVTVSADGREEKRNALIAAACNGTQIGGGIAICPVAEVDDHKIDVVIVDCIGGKWKIVKAFMKLMKGKILEYPATSHFLCDRVTFTPDAPRTVQLDGELYENLIFDVRLKKGLAFYR